MSAAPRGGATEAASTEPALPPRPCQGKQAAVLGLRVASQAAGEAGNGAGPPDGARWFASAAFWPPDATLLGIGDKWRVS
jgi:hypothetical protein